jgi:hypothetical protein
MNSLEQPEPVGSGLDVGPELGEHAQGVHVRLCYDTGV